MTRAHRTSCRPTPCHPPLHRCSPEDALELEEWLTKLFVEGIELGGRAFAGQPGMQPEAAAQRGPQAQAQAMREELSALPVRELKQRLQASGMDATGCTEKSDLVDRLLAGASGAAAAAGSSCSGSGPAPPADERADERQCIVCGAARGAGIKLKRCGGCLADQVLFCSGACQAAFWPRHKAECKAAQRAARGR